MTAKIIELLGHEFFWLVTVFLVFGYYFNKHVITFVNAKLNNDINIIHSDINLLKKEISEFDTKMLSKQQELQNYDKFYQEQLQKFINDIKADFQVKLVNFQQNCSDMHKENIQKLESALEKNKLEYVKSFIKHSFEQTKIFAKKSPKFNLSNLISLIKK